MPDENKEPPKVDPKPPPPPPPPPADRNLTETVIPVKPDTMIPDVKK